MAHSARSARSEAFISQYRAGARTARGPLAATLPSLSAAASLGVRVQILEALEGVPDLGPNGLSFLRTPAKRRGAVVTAVLAAAVHHLPAYAETDLMAAAQSGDIQWERYWRTLASHRRRGGDLADLAPIAQFAAWVLFELATFGSGYEPAETDERLVLALIHIGDPVRAGGGEATERGDDPPQAPPLLDVPHSVTAPRGPNHRRMTRTHPSGRVVQLAA